ncbi:MAG: ABC transporter ATP-binding protein [Proteobacteria bacterium]|nr:ABC transporter ATP-binding protein [Pseudomonadota bacterium]MBU1582408.1 ABC transporter ATP-binding protein [Pseudomonadota bacterium]MBU2456066.1 ABC transporter ATP-binding protein [Pseudomonadota bacterium]
MMDIVKKFGDFTANDMINLTVHQGEVHALLGENGAGKTTLMNVLYGMYKPTSGRIKINGRQLDITDPKIAIKNGIGMVHQHFMLVDSFTVTQNIILGNETTKLLGILDIEKAEKEVALLSEQYGLTVDPKALIQDLSVGSQQRVEILKALYRGAQILILDEPTAVLTPQEIQELVAIIRNLTRQGKSIIIITHKLKEIKEIADFCTIIRRGRHIDTVDVSRVTQNELAEKMVGREVSFKVKKEKQSPGEIALEIKDLVVEDARGICVVSHLNLTLHKGEILGIAGVDGNGQTQLIEALTGLRKVKSGQIRVQKKNIANQSPGKIINDCKVSHIPEDRQKRGLIFEFDIAENLILETYFKPQFSKGFTLLQDQIYDHATALINKFDIRPADSRLLAKALSGGNQQKMIIAREVANDPEILIAAQPTRGLDVGAIEYVHQTLVAQRNQGKAVLLISFELDEIINVSDRIAVIFEGKIVGIIDAQTADEKQIGFMMAGGTA